MEKGKRLIDAGRFEKSIQLSIESWGRDCSSNTPVIVRTYKDVLTRIRNAPAVDAVEVVRCKNCIESDPCDVSRNRVWCRRMGRYMKEDGYCSEGDDAGA